MNKALMLAALGTVTLTSCSVIGTRSAAVSGQLRGFNPDQDLRLAVVGFNGGQYVADGRQAQVLDKFLTGGYVLTLPRDVASGTYRVVVFRDMNHNNRYDVSDTVVSKPNSKLLVYAPRDNYLFSSIKYGWNIYDNTTGRVQTDVLDNYDIEAN